MGGVHKSINHTFSSHKPVTLSKMVNDVKLLLIISATDQAAEATFEEKITLSRVR